MYQVLFSAGINAKTLIQSTSYLKDSEKSYFKDFNCKAGDGKTGQTYKLTRTVLSDEHLLSRRENCPAYPANGKLD